MSSHSRHAGQSARLFMLLMPLVVNIIHLSVAQNAPNDDSNISRQSVNPSTVNQISKGPVDPSLSFTSAIELPVPHSTVSLTTPPLSSPTLSVVTTTMSSLFGTQISTQISTATLSNDPPIFTANGIANAGATSPSKHRIQPNSGNPTLLSLPGFGIFGCGMIALSTWVGLIVIGQRAVIQL